MRTDFKAYYFDGVTAKRHEVIITIAPTSLRIQKTDKRVIEWDLKDVAQTQGFYEKEPLRLENGRESLVIEDKGFSHAFSKIAPEHAKGFRIPSGGKNKVFKIISLSAITAVIAVMIYLYGIPFFSSAIAGIIPHSFEETLGNKVWEQLGRDFKECRGPAAGSAAEEILSILIKSAPANPYTFKIHIVKTDMVNAFALPGGHIVIMSGIMESTATPEELAGVLAHEMQHILKRHTLKAMMQGLSTYMLITFISGDFSGVSQIAHTVGNLRYSRSFEKEADIGAIKNLAHAGINPQGMVGFFSTLEKTQDKTPEFLMYLLSHPLTETRVGYLKKEVTGVEGEFKPLLTGVDWEKAKTACMEEGGRVGFP